MSCFLYARHTGIVIIENNKVWVEVIKKFISVGKTEKKMLMRANEFWLH